MKCESLIDTLCMHPKLKCEKDVMYPPDDVYWEIHYAHHATKSYDRRTHRLTSACMAYQIRDSWREFFSIICFFFFFFFHALTTSRQRQQMNGNNSIVSVFFSHSSLIILLFNRIFIQIHTLITCTQLYYCYFYVWCFVILCLYFSHSAVCMPVVFIFVCRINAIWRMLHFFAFKKNKRINRHLFFYRKQRKPEKEREKIALAIILHCNKIEWRKKHISQWFSNRTRVNAFHWGNTKIM